MRACFLSLSLIHLGRWGHHNLSGNVAFALALALLRQHGLVRRFASLGKRLLLDGDAVDPATVLRPAVVALAVALGRVMALPEPAPK